MTAPLLMVTGTATGIGKTHVAEALLLAWAGFRDRVVGFKPIESGVDDASLSDAARLERLSTFHVKRVAAPYMLSRPVSPHLAARQANVEIDLARVAGAVDELRHAADAVLVELPGGLFSPLSAMTTNADLARIIAPTHLVLVAPDRLGVLHDVGATVRAARAEKIAIDSVVLVAPEEPDASTGTNASELRIVVGLEVLGPIPRAEPSTLASRPDIVGLVRRL